MKPQPVNGARRRAFTLIELLTVITIIGVLSAMLFPAVIHMTRMSAHKRAALQAAAIAHAVKEYRTTYSRWPGQTQGALDGQVEPAVLLAALTNNPRNVTFINLRPGDVSAERALVDPWQRPFAIVMDENGDGNIDFSATLDSLTVATNVDNETACVMSWGRIPDEERERVISWRQ